MRILLIFIVYFIQVTATNAESYYCKSMFTNIDLVLELPKKEWDYIPHEKWAIKRSDTKEVILWCESDGVNNKTYVEITNETGNPNEWEFINYVGKIGSVVYNKQPEKVLDDFIECRRKA